MELEKIEREKEEERKRIEYAGQVCMVAMDKI